MAQAFDRVWHPGFLFKLKPTLPSTYFLILKSYLEDRYSIWVCQGGEYSEFFPVEVSVPQGSVLGPLLYTLNTSDFPTHPKIYLATFPDDSCILTNDPSPEISSQTL